MFSRWRILVWVLLFLAPMLACGLGGDAVDDQATTATVAEPAATELPEATDPPAATATAAPTEPAGPQPVSDVQDVQSAVVQIVAEGSFIDPQVGQMLNVAGSGSGFIIDPSGIAVTNNHVVTGAALLRVYVGGESEPRNARVLGVSECSDLAVIDIEGEGYPYLEWYQGDINVGLDVYAAGFPLGDPEFTLTRGIVSKANASGETNWASVDDVLEHDATINPGNSGGPLVTAEAKVAGVNYAGRSDTNQYFAINPTEARPTIEEMRAGNDVTSIGINGMAVADPESGLYGIWVSSVESGSPADEADVQAGDIIISLENLVLATDGTMSDYCDILRSRSPEDVMRIEVLRFETQQVLEGQLNGDALVVSTDFSQEFGDEVAGEGAGAAIDASYTGYTSVTDNSGILQVEIPNEWVDIDGSPWVDENGAELGPAIAAAPSLDGYYNTWNTPGMEFATFFDLGSETTVDELLTLFDFSDSCTYGGREDYADALYTGQYDVWEDCGDAGSLYIVLVTVPENRAFHTLVTVQIVSDADLEALDHILNSFIVSQ